MISVMPLINGSGRIYTKGRTAVMNPEFDLLLKAWKGSGLAAGMKEDEVIALLESCSYRTERLKAEELYAIGGDKLQDLRIVGAGEIRAEMVGPSGKQILIDTLATGRILAPALLFASENILPVTLLANEDSILFRIGKQEFKGTMHKYPALMENFIGMISDISAFLMKKIHQLSLRSLQGKIGDYLLRFYTKDGSSRIVVDSSWKELADRFGVNRQSLARSLSQLEEEGIIRVDGKSIEILQPQRLSRLE